MVLLRTQLPPAPADYSPSVRQSPLDLCTIVRLGYHSLNPTPEAHGTSAAWRPGKAGYLSVGEGYSPGAVMMNDQRAMRMRSAVAADRRPDWICSFRCSSQRAPSTRPSRMRMSI